MPVILYAVVIFLLLFFLVFFWFLQGGGSSSSSRYSPVFIEKDKGSGPEGILLLSAVRRIDRLAERGRWSLFTGIFLILIEFFALFGMLLENRGIFTQFTYLQHGYLIGGLIFFFVTLFAIVLSARLISSEKELGSALATDFIGGRGIEERISSLNSEQKKQLANYLSDKQQSLEGTFAFIMALLGSAVTLLIIWLSAWLIQFIN